jgi:predicted metalloprotease with PDZ domain
MSRDAGTLKMHEAGQNVLRLAGVPTAETDTRRHDDSQLQLKSPRWIGGAYCPSELHRNCFTFHNKGSD